MTFALFLLAENKAAEVSSQPVFYLCFYYFSLLLLFLTLDKSFKERARAEVTELLDKNDGKYDVSMNQEFSYLERCIKESLRLYPPVATMLRYTAEDLQLSNYIIIINWF